jgi:alpha-tubulin suppressor-like RCC1 family protein
MVNKVFIDPLTGNVGIGSGVPTSSLDVGGEVGMKLVLTDAPFPSAASYSTYFTPDYDNTVDSIDQATNREFPPAALTTYNMQLQTTYGYGTYVVSSSSEYNSTLLSWKAFNKDGTTSLWCSTNAYAYQTTGAYNRATQIKTVTDASDILTGEYLQIQLPCAIALNAYSITSGTTWPTTWWVAGSTNGGNWNLIDTKSSITTGWTANVARTFTTSNTKLYTHFRLIVNAVRAGINDVTEIGEWLLYGDTTSKYPSYKRSLKPNLGVYDVGQMVVSTNTSANVTSSSESTPTALFNSFNSNINAHRWSTSNNIYRNSADATIVPNIIIRFPQTLSISSYSLTANVSSIEAPSKWNLYGSNIGTNNGWLLLDSKSSETSWSAYQKVQYNVSSAPQYNAYKFDFLRNNSPTGAAITLGNLEFTAQSIVTPFKVELTSFGGVGIGTTSPSTQLDIVGNVKVIGDVRSCARFGNVKALPFDNGVINGFGYSLVIGNDGQVYHAGVMDYPLAGFGNGSTGSAFNTGSVHRATLPAGEIAKSISQGSGYVHVLTESNRIYGWGRGDSHGILGLGQDVNASTPSLLATPIDQILYVQTESSTIGGDFSVGHTAGFITSTGRLFMWGYNLEGQLGIGDNLNRNAPVEVSKPSGYLWGGFHCGCLNTFAWTTLTSGGKLYATGENNYGQLGVGDTTKRSSFTPVLKASNNLQLEGIKKIRTTTSWYSSAYAATYILTNDGEIYTMGFNANGQLGNGNTTNQNKAQGPIISNVKDFDLSRGCVAHGVHVVKNDGTLWVWGYNGHTCFGIQSIAINAVQTTPVLVPGINDAVRVYGGKQYDQHAVFLFKADGSIWFAGVSYNGISGMNVNDTYSLFTKVPTPERIVDLRMVTYYHVSVDGNRAHTLWLGESGKLYGSGDNAYGQLGRGFKDPNTRVSGLHAAFMAF